MLHFRSYSPQSRLLDTGLKQLSLEARGMLEILRDYCWVEGFIWQDQSHWRSCYGIAPQQGKRLFPELQSFFAAAEINGRAVWVNCEAEAEKSRANSTRKTPTKPEEKPEKTPTKVGENSEISPTLVGDKSDFLPVSPLLHAHASKVKYSKVKYSKEESKSHCAIAPAVKDIFALKFSQAFEKLYGMPYQSKSADFIQFASLTKNCASNNWELSEARIQKAVDNYFASEIGTHTLADLCVRFSTFYKSKLDRFGKPAEATPNSNGEVMPKGVTEAELQTIMERRRITRDEAIERVRTHPRNVWITSY